MQRIYKVIIGALAAVIILTPLPALAHSENDDNPTTGSGTQRGKEGARPKPQDIAELRTNEKIEAKKTEIRQQVDAKKTEIRQKLDDKKRQVCQSREKQINTRMQHIVEMREKQINHIGKITDRVKEFYVKKGNTAADYDSLVNTVDSKRAAALAALEVAKADAKFSCDSDGPKADAQDFKTKRDVLVSAIREYRTSVKNLIVSVKAAQSADGEVTS